MRRARSYFWKIGLILMAAGLILSVTAFGVGAAKGRKAFGALVELEETTYENIRGLEIETDMGTVEVRRGDGFSVSGNIPEQMKIRQEVEDGVLSVKAEYEKSRGVWPLLGFWFNGPGDGEWQNPELVITIPEDVSLEELEVSSGMGEVSIVDITVKGETEIHAGAGRVELTDFDGKGELSLECGAGEIFCQGRFQGEADIECGLGSIRMNLEGKEEDYGYQVDGGVGSVQIGSRSYGGVGMMQAGGEHAKNYLNVHCGVGEVIILFE